MYYINKIIGFMLSPIGVAVAGLVIAVACAWLKWVRSAKWIGGITVVWLWLWMTPFMTRVVGVPLEREFLVDGRVPAVDSFPKMEAIVLHGGSMGVLTNFSPYAEMWTSADRVWQAARLLKAGKAPRIIATGDGARESTLGLLKDFGVDEKCVEFLDARNTEEEAKGVWLQLGVGEWRNGGVVKINSSTHQFKNSSTSRPKVLLVTSAWHMKRARLMFEKYAPDVEVVCAPSDFEMSMATGGAVGWKDLLPDVNVFALNTVAVHEWVGIIGYRFLR